MVTACGLSPFARELSSTAATEPSINSDAVLRVAAAHFGVEREAVDLEGEDGRSGGNFVDDVGAIGGIVDVGLEIVGEAIFRIVLLDQ